MMQERTVLVREHAQLEAGMAWQPVAGEEVVSLLDSIAHLDPHSRANVRDKAVRILGRGVGPGRTPESATGLVVGYVQSGKTLSFTTVTALAKDNGFDCIIVITGISVPLFEQSSSRLDRDLRLARRADRQWLSLKNPRADGDTQRIVNAVLADWADGNVPPSQRRTMLITVMKNHLHLKNLTSLLEGLTRRPALALVIDDEADQAGLNTRVRASDESPTYAKLSALRSTLPRHTYVQYTATPQAPLLINLIDNLSPRFVEVLTPGPDYVGGKDFFIERPEFIRTIPEEDLPTPDSPSLDPPDSFLEALRLYLVGVAAGYHRAGGEGNRSMLIHPSSRTSVHSSYLQWTRRCCETWGDTLGLPISDPDRVDLLEEFHGAYVDLAGSTPDLPTFEELKPHLSRAVRNVHIVEVNAAAGRTPEVDWKCTYPIVLVGGQALDRGFTVEGLTLTYMPRGVGVGTADNVQQRARFLGYRRHYFNYCRVYLDAEAKAAYRNYVIHEEDMRGRLEEHQRTGKPLSEWKREFFLTRRLQPTRRSVLGFDYMRIRFGGDWWAHTSPHEDMAVAERNRAVIRAYIDGVELVESPGSPERSDMMRHAWARDLRFSDLYERLLVGYAVTRADAAREFIALQLVLDEYREREPDARCSVYVMSRGEARVRALNARGEIENLFQGAHPDKRGSIYPGDRALRDEHSIAVQIHNVNVRGTAIVVPTLAIWVPASVGVDLVVQDQGRGS